MNPTFRLAAALIACQILSFLAPRPAHAAESTGTLSPIMVRQGDRIFIPAESPLRSRLAVDATAAQASSRSLSLPAVVEANPARTVNVLPPLIGRLVELKVGLGDSVRAGQTVAWIGSPDLPQAQADRDKAADALDLAKRSLERARGVKEAGASASKDVEAAESAYRQALAEDQRARARLQTLTGTDSAPRAAEGQPRLLAITAPIAGTVTALNVGRGAFINDATAPLLTIANTDRVWITAQAPENLVGSIAKGQPVSVALSAYPNQPLSGRVAFISPLMEPDTRRVKVRIEFANPDGRLRPNMYATATFAVAQGTRVTVPPSALLMNNDSTTVFVEVAPWTFQRRVVELGSEDGSRVQVMSGLKSGERVLIRGGVLLND